MKNNEIKRAAKKFIKALNGKTDFVSVEEYLKGKGYKVVFFNTETGDRELERFGLAEKAQKSPAFTYTGAANIIFIDNNASSEDKNYLLYHEAGHIELGHAGYARISTKNKFLMEFEADTFAQMVVNPTKTHKSALPLVLLVIALLCISFYAGTAFPHNHYIPDGMPAGGTVETNGAEQTEDIVYVTRTGKKYHRESCGYLRNDSMAMSRTQAAQHYSPCSICNPQ